MRYRLIDALSQHKATHKRGLGKIEVSVSRELYQASCGIERFVEEKSILSFKEGRGQNKRKRRRR